MADEEIKNDIVEPVEETVEPTDKREGIIDFIKGKLKGRNDGEEVQGKEEVVVDEFIRESDVPSVFLEAAKQDGWTDEDIKDFAKNKTDEELKELAEQFEVEEELEEEPELDDEDEELIENMLAELENKGDPDYETVVKNMREEILKEVLAELSPKFESLDDFRTEQADRQTVTMFETANKIMDGASKDFPALGKLDDMPKFTTGSRKGQLIPTSPEFKARSEVYQLAYDLVSAGRSNSIESAMDDAMAWYRGKYGQKETERKVIRDLKKQEQKLSGSRTGKETKREYDNDRDEMLDAIRQMQKAAGIDT